MSLCRNRLYLRFHPNRGTHDRKIYPCVFWVEYSSFHFNNWSPRVQPRQRLYYQQVRKGSRRGLDGRDALNFPPCRVAYWWTWCVRIWCSHHRNFLGRGLNLGWCSMTEGSNRIGNLVTWWYWPLQWVASPYSSWREKYPERSAFLATWIKKYLRWYFIIAVLEESRLPLLDIFMLQEAFNHYVTILLVKLALLESQATAFAGVSEFLGNKVSFQLLKSLHYDVIDNFYLLTFVGCSLALIYNIQHNCISIKCLIKRPIQQKKWTNALLLSSGNECFDLKYMLASVITIFMKKKNDSLYRRLYRNYFIKGFFNFSIYVKAYFWL